MTCETSSTPTTLTAEPKNLSKDILAVVNKNHEDIKRALVGPKPSWTLPALNPKAAATAPAILTK